jgi:hypothetical protein
LQWARILLTMEAFTVVRTIGRGSFGKAVQAMVKRTGDHVVIKEIGAVGVAGGLCTGRTLTMAAAVVEVQLLRR